MYLVKKFSYWLTNKVWFINMLEQALAKGNWPAPFEQDNLCRCDVGVEAYYRIINVNLTFGLGCDNIIVFMIHA